MRAFFQRHLDPATRLGEALFGLIMALGITGAVQLGVGQATHRELLVAVLGCNIAWGVVDGVMFAMLALFERGRKARIINSVRSALTDEIALERIHAELGDRLQSLMTPEERAQVYSWILRAARQSDREQPRIRREDIFGGIAVGLLILVATMPVVIPFVFVSDLQTAVRTSNLIALGLLFWVGWWWGRLVGANPLHTGAGVTGVGLVLVLITIALGG